MKKFQSIVLALVFLVVLIAVVTAVTTKVSMRSNAAGQWQQKSWGWPTGAPKFEDFTNKEGEFNDWVQRGNVDLSKINFEQFNFSKFDCNKISEMRAKLLEAADKAQEAFQNVQSQTGR